MRRYNIPTGKVRLCRCGLVLLRQLDNALDKVYNLYVKVSRLIAAGCSFASFRQDAA